MNVEFLEPTSESEQSEFHLEKIYTSSGRDLEFDPKFPQIELFPGEEIIFEYADGRIFKLQLNNNIINDPWAFLQNNPNLLRTLEMYSRLDHKNLSALKKTKFIQGALTLGNTTESTGSTIKISLSKNNSDVKSTISDPIEGILLNGNLFRCSQIYTDSNNVITSVVLDISTDGEELNYNLDQSLPLLAATN